MDALSDSVENLPMMAERSLIRVDDVDLFKLGEKDRERLIALLGICPPTAAWYLPMARRSTSRTGGRRSLLRPSAKMPRWWSFPSKASGIDGLDHPAF